MARVVVASQAPGGLDAYIDPRFARCAFYTVVDVDDSRVELTNVVQNTSVDAFRGAGIQAAQTIAGNQAKVLITGNVGPNAFRALSAAGIAIVTGASGKVRDAIEKYRKGLLSETREPTVKGHSGMGIGGTQAIAHQSHRARLSINGWRLEQVAAQSDPFRRRSSGATRARSPAVLDTNFCQPDSIKRSASSDTLSG